MIKSSVIAGTFLFLIVSLLSGQDDRFVTLSYTIKNYVTNGTICPNNRSIHFITLQDEINGGDDVLNSFDFISGGTFNVGDLVYDKDNKLTVKFKDLNNNNQTISFNLNTLGLISLSKNVWKFTLPSCDHESTITVNALISEPPYIKASGTNLTPQICVTNTTQKSNVIALETNGTFWGADKIFELALQVSTDLYFRYNVNEVKLSRNTSVYSLSYSDIAGTYASQWWEVPLYFRIKTTEIFIENNLETAGNTAFSKLYEDAVEFYKSVPRPTSVVLRRTACKDYIDITMPTGTGANYNNYRFSILNGADWIALNPSSISGDNLIYTCSVPNYNGYPTSGTFNVQIADKSNDKCAINLPVDGKVKPERPNFTLTPTTVGTSAYNISRHDLSDGVVKLKINNITKTDNIITAYYGKTGSTPQAVRLDGITTAPNSLTRKSLWSITGLEATSYTFYLMDGDTCISIPENATVTLTKPDPIQITSIENTKSVTCNERNRVTNPAYHHDGVVSLNWSGGIPPYIFDLNSSEDPFRVGIGSYTLDSLTRGSQYIRIRDDYGEEVLTIPTVARNDEFKANISYIPIDCFGNNTTVKVDAENNNSGITYYLYNSDNTLNERSQENITAISYEFSGKNAGIYQIKAISDGCIASRGLNITQPDDLLINAVASKIAKFDGNDGKIFISLSGGTPDYNFNVTGNNTTVFTGKSAFGVSLFLLKAGYYNIDVTDSKGCSKSVSNIRVRQPDAPLKLDFTSKNVDCFGNATGEIYPVSTGGWGHYQYRLNTANYNSGIITGLKASITVDTLYVTDSALVTEKKPVFISQPLLLESSPLRIHNLLCNNDKSGSVKLNISGGTEPYSLSNENINWVIGDSIKGLSAGHNQVIYVQDFNECKTNTTVSLSEPSIVESTIDTVVNAYCHQANGGININASGGKPGYIFNASSDDMSDIPSNKDGVFSNIYSGVYTIVISDKNLCEKTITALVSDINGPKLEAFTLDSVTCPNGKDGKIHINFVTGGSPEYSYLLNDNPVDTIITGLSRGSYLLRIKDSKGCKTDRNINILEPSPFLLDFEIGKPYCNDSKDGSIYTFASGANGNLSYIWNTGKTEQSILNIGSGKYILTIKDKKNCTYDKTFEVIAPPEPSAGWKETRGLLCSGNILELDGGDFTTYLWSKDNKQISTSRYLVISETGNYNLKVIDTKGCTGNNKFYLEVSDHPLDAKLLVPDSAHVAEEINVVDVTWPVPDSIQWSFDMPVDLMFSNNWSQHFSSEQVGIINVTLRAWYGGCSSDSSKTVTIYSDDSYQVKKMESSQPLILGYIAYPNPNDGDFYIKVKLSRKADIKLSVYQGSVGMLLNTQSFAGLDEYDIPINLTNYSSGLYLIVLQADGEQQGLKVVIE